MTLLLTAEIEDDLQKQFFKFYQMELQFNMTSIEKKTNDLLQKLDEMEACNR